MKFIRHLLIEFQKHKGWLQAIAAIITIVGFPKAIPEGWWDSQLLSWSISSRLLLPAIIAILILSYIAVSKFRHLNNKLALLKEKKRIADLSPEDQADITKKQFSDFGRYINRLSGSSSNIVTVINDGSNDKKP